MDRREVKMIREIENMTVENNRLKNDIRQQAEQVKREKEKLTEENNRLKNDILQQAELMQAVVFHLNLGKIHIYGELK